MFVDLDWPLNASRGLSAPAEFLVAATDNLVTKADKLKVNLRHWLYIYVHQFQFHFSMKKDVLGASCHSSESAIGRGKMSKGGWRRFGMEGQNHRGLGDGSPPAGCQGRSPGRNWRIFKVVTNKFYAFFGSISHIFTYICLCFFSFLQPPFH